MPLRIARETVALLVVLVAGIGAFASVRAKPLCVSKGEPNAYSRSDLIFDAAGNLYGTTGGFNGQPNMDYGTVFMLTPSLGGGWSCHQIYHFKGSPSDGDIPAAGLVIDGSGNLYGTTISGGPGGHGTVFELTLNGSEWSWTSYLRLLGERWRCSGFSRDF